VDANSIAYLNELSHLHGSERPVCWMKLRYTGKQSVAEFSISEREGKRVEKNNEKKERICVINEI